jgi:hypothetical protein
MNASEQKLRLIFKEVVSMKMEHLSLVMGQQNTTEQLQDSLAKANNLLPIVLLY